MFSCRLRGWIKGGVEAQIGGARQFLLYYHYICFLSNAPLTNLDLEGQDQKPRRRVGGLHRGGEKVTWPSVVRQESNRNIEQSALWGTQTTTKNTKLEKEVTKNKGIRGFIMLPLEAFGSSSGFEGFGILLNWTSRPRSTKSVECVWRTMRCWKPVVHDPTLNQSIRTRTDGPVGRCASFI